MQGASYWYHGEPVAEPLLGLAFRETPLTNSQDVTPVALVTSWMEPERQNKNQPPKRQEQKTPNLRRRLRDGQGAWLHRSSLFSVAPFPFGLCKGGKLNPQGTGNQSDREQDGTLTL